MIFILALLLIAQVAVMEAADKKLMAPPATATAAAASTDPIVAREIEKQREADETTLFEKKAAENIAFAWSDPRFAQAANAINNAITNPANRAGERRVADIIKSYVGARYGAGSSVEMKGATWRYCGRGHKDTFMMVREAIQPVDWYLLRIKRITQLALVSPASNSASEHQVGCGPEHHNDHLEASLVTTMANGCYLSCTFNGYSRPILGTVYDATLKPTGTTCSLSRPSAKDSIAEDGVTPSSLETGPLCTDLGRRPLSCHPTKPIVIVRQSSSSYMHDITNNKSYIIPGRALFFPNAGNKILMMSRIPKLPRLSTTKEFFGLTIHQFYPGRIENPACADKENPRVTLTEVQNLLAEERANACMYDMSISPDGKKITLIGWPGSSATQQVWRYDEGSKRFVESTAEAGMAPSSRDDAIPADSTDHKYLFRSISKSEVPKAVTKMTFYRLLPDIALPVAATTPQPATTAAKSDPATVTANANPKDSGCIIA